MSIKRRSLESMLELPSVAGQHWDRLHKQIQWALLQDAGAECLPRVRYQSLGRQNSDALLGLYQWAHIPEILQRRLIVAWQGYIEMTANAVDSWPEVTGA